MEAEAERLRTLGDFFWPTAGGVSDGFGYRIHPILKIRRLHNGADIGGACGQPIWATQAGTVTKVAPTGYNGGSGHNVRINHGDINGDDSQTAYLHMDRIEVKVGQKVGKGERIGTVGSTGLSTACHLHLTLYKNGRASDPGVPQEVNTDRDLDQRLTPRAPDPDLEPPQSIPPTQTGATMGPHSDTTSQTGQGWPGYSTGNPPQPEPPASAPHEAHDAPGGHGGHGAHKWMMLLMCLPLVGIGLWSLLSGRGGAGLISGLLCMGMMAVMHFAMGGMGKGHRH